jgi:hypothetical protein
MQIDGREEQCQNAESPIDERFESDSNVTDESDLQPEKHFWQMFSTDDGT